MIDFIMNIHVCWPNRILHDDLYDVVKTHSDKPIIYGCFAIYIPVKNGYRVIGLWGKHFMKVAKTNNKIICKPKTNIFMHPSIFHFVVHCFKYGTTITRK